MNILLETYIQIIASNVMHIPKGKPTMDYHFRIFSQKTPNSTNNKPNPLRIIKSIHSFFTITEVSFELAVITKLNQNDNN